MHSDLWFMRRRFLNIYQNFPYFAPYWAPLYLNKSESPSPRQCVALIKMYPHTCAMKIDDYRSFKYTSTDIELNANYVIAIYIQWIYVITVMYMYVK